MVRVFQGFSLSIKCKEHRRARSCPMNAVSLANNHVLDYEYDALIEMLGILLNIE